LNTAEKRLWTALRKHALGHTSVGGSVESRRGQRPAWGRVSASASYDHPGARLDLSASQGLRGLDAHLPTLHTVPPLSMAARTTLWAWTAFPPRASVGHKLYTVAWSQILRPTSKCGPYGCRWPRHGRNWLKRWSGYSRIKGRVMRMVRAQDNPKSRLEAPPTQCPRCKTLMKVRKCVPLPGRKFVDVDYRCDECGAEVLRAVPRGR
jgi:hypothetical protein